MPVGSAHRPVSTCEQSRGDGIHGGSLTRSTRRATQAKLDKMLLKYAHDILDKTPEDVKLRTMGPSGA